MTKPNKKRNTGLIILLLLLLAAAIWFFFFREEEIALQNFTPQGTTTIKSSDPLISIWDYSAVDGDTINVYFDGKLIFDTLAIDEKPVIYKPGRLSKGRHWIGVTAISEGMMGSASPHISIKAGSDSFDIDIDSWIDSAQGSWVINVE